MPQLSNTMAEQWFCGEHGGINLKLISVSLRYWHYDDYSGEHIAILDIAIAIARGVMPICRYS